MSEFKMSPFQLIKKKIRGFLTKVTGDASLRDDADLLSTSVLDSLTMMDLIVFIEIEFGQRIAIGDLRPEQFQSIDAIANLVDRMSQIPKTKVG